ncbi:hypothetical protein FXO38_32903 [Capsicum annuum]|nr:hypothetical protein FXO38_32903 [Capsicum annuum]
MVLVVVGGGVCGRRGGTRGGIGWWCLWWCRYSWCLFVCWHWLVVFMVVAVGVLAWAFEAIPPLQKQLMDYPDEVSYQRMFMWLAAKSNTNIKEANLFNPPNGAVVHPWIVPTEKESVMTSYITLGHVDAIADPMVELIKKELARAIVIRRAVRQGPSHPSLPSCSHCECDECKDRQDKLFEKVEAISKDIKEFKSKRCVIPFKKVREPHTPTALVRRKKRVIRDVLFTRKSKKIVIPLSPKAVEVQEPVKKVEIYAEFSVEEKRDLRQAKNSKPGAPDYPRPPFSP